MSFNLFFLLFILIKPFNKQEEEQVADDYDDYDNNDEENGVVLIDGNEFRRIDGRIYGYNEDGSFEADENGERILTVLVF